MGIGPPAPLSVTPRPPMLQAGGLPAATIADAVPMVSIPSLGMRNSPANPAVVAATSAALGVHTPAACIPVPAGGWTPGSPQVILGGVPALTSTSTCQCACQGTISFNQPGQAKVTG
jgi:hypothetical protein